ncbi:MAG TPA: chromosome partitioning protein ParB [Syntrophomonas sp.]|nr:chromosome partitioning protein ParB [Syntrophomonas sp.]
MEITELNIEMIIAREDQPRKVFDEESLKELASSLTEHGVLQPVLVREKGDRYEIIAGERRWRAAQIAGLGTIPAIIRQLDDLQAGELSLIENLQREDLTAVEEAQAYHQMIERYQYTQEMLAQKIGKSRSHIANTLRILNLPPSILEMIESKQLSAGHARAILSLPGQKEQLAAAREITARGLSVREAEKRVKTKKTVQEIVFEKSAEIVDLEERLQKHLGTKAEITTFNKGGRIQISYYSNEDLERIMEMLIRK